MSPKAATKAEKNRDACLLQGHDWKEYIDPRSGGFMRCQRCGLDIDCEDPDSDLG